MADEYENYGPAMRALTEKQRRFVKAFVAMGARRGKATAAAEVAGYAGNPNSRKVWAHHLRHNPKVLEAIKEFASGELSSGAVEAASVMRELMTDPDAPHAVRLSAAKEVLALGGITTVTQHKVTVEHIQNDADKVKELREIVASAGLSLEVQKQLLGPHFEAPVIDVEAVEVAQENP